MNEIESAMLSEWGFSKNYNLRRHLRTVHSTATFNYSVCDKGFSRLYNLSRHLKLRQTSSEENKLQCPLHQKFVPRPSSSRGNRNSASKSTERVPVQSAFNSRLKTIGLENGDNFKDLKKILNAQKEAVYELISSELEKNELKVNCMFLGTCRKETLKSVITDEKPFITENNVLLLSN
ncbi:hypothetical protein AVEN_153205-1 [Araneus ventricosus]|uniref:C2H2-type domain-containing protein n=1 Tax=Araneus ventricosus TaxID=182803 RepID=A0A4Y2WN12_ARAVE|nr:hypothetical protein AVEN_153205-1 [Araneus ventricosus]